MINGVEVSVAFSEDGAAALGQVAGELEKLGYERKSEKPGELKMVFKGKWITADVEKMRHSLTVAPGGDGLSFKFSTGLIASSWSAEDKEWAQARASEVVAAIQQ